MASKQFTYTIVSGQRVRVEKRGVTRDTCKDHFNSTTEVKINGEFKCLQCWLEEEKRYQESLVPDKLTKG